MNAVAPVSVSTHEVDPISFEVIRHGKLSAITEEQGTTIRAISGSSIVTDVADFNTGIYGVKGEVITMEWHVGFKSGCMSGMIRTLSEKYQVFSVSTKATCSS